jgi:hypothetical protein
MQDLTGTWLYDTCFSYIRTKFRLTKICYELRGYSRPPPPPKPVWPFWKTQTYLASTESRTAIYGYPSRSAVAVPLYRCTLSARHQCSGHKYCFVLCVYHILLHSFGSILYRCMYGCVFVCFCLIVQITYCYRYVCSVLFILFHCVVVCAVCV